MGEPYNPKRRDFLSSDKILEDFSDKTDKVLDVDEWLKKYAQDLNGQSYRPDDELLKQFYQLYNFDIFGRQLIEWILDLTVRMPYPNIGTSIEAGALQAARYSARAAIGEMLMQAILLGKKLSEETKNV